ncbi:MAG TPA: NAD-dependent succinate-semialdehyde dehydrogenase [Patescibacteria group bacterium]|jgi:succinate-semialdehyde dehydrogenase/glutarate-semialdehyde dehydrogenase|nr:NAD-dependent succinate-semialdehyde dehydrogenase [Patescibacteria group bacterium]
MAIQSKNPATEEVLKTFNEISDTELETKLALAATAFELWKEFSFEARAKLFMKMSDYLQEHKAELSKLMTLEMGKPITAGDRELEKSALTCEYFAENAERFLAPEHVDTNASESFVRFDPLGIILGVMPWNFPFWQVCRGAAPALMAGNVMVVKHASNVPQSAMAIEKAFLDCGFPAGVFQNLLLSAGRVEKVIRDPRIKGVTLTGSEKAGSEVAKIAGSEIKKSVLELGGSDPFIVFEDADLTLACEIGLASRISSNAGQACNAAKRFIVHENVADEFTRLLTESFKKLKIGDPMDPAVQIGPLSSEQILKDVERQVNESVKLGAKVTTGGKRWGNKGHFYEPTVLTNVKKGMPAYDEEVFGPVAAIIVFKNESEAIKIANDTLYGLGATIMTANTEKAKQLAPRIEAGNVFVNQQVRSDPRMPFGGIKKSGYGRELGEYGIKEFVNIKTVLIK